MDCAPTCLRMVAEHYGRNFSIHKLREFSEIDKDGVNLLGIADAAVKIGFRTSGVKINVEQLREANLPVIIHWDQNHFVVLHKIWPKSSTKEIVYTVADPAKGIIKYSSKEFANTGTALEITAALTGLLYFWSQCLL